MKKAIVDFAKCKEYEPCFSKCMVQKKCKTKAIFKIDPGESAVVDTIACNGCGVCVTGCPVGAIFIKEV